MNYDKSIFEKVTALQTMLNKLPGCNKVVQDVIATLQVHEPNTFDFFVTDKDLRKVSEKLFNDGHHARAVEEGFKYLNNLVKRKSKLVSLDGSGLMKQAFSAKSPVLKINAGENQSEQDEQLGYMEIFSGCMTGIRNPRAHEHDWEDSETKALQLLSIANHLVERVKLSMKCE